MLRVAQKSLAHCKRLGKERPGGHCLYPPLVGAARSALLLGCFPAFPLRAPSSPVIKALSPGPPFSLPCHVEMKPSLCSSATSPAWVFANTNGDFSGWFWCFLVFFSF